MYVFQGPSTSAVDSLPFLFLVVRLLMGRGKKITPKNGELSKDLNYKKFQYTWMLLNVTPPRSPPEPGKSRPLSWGLP